LVKYQDFQIKNHDNDRVGIMSGICELLVCLHFWPQNVTTCQIYV